MLFILLLNRKSWVETEASSVPVWWPRIQSVRLGGLLEGPHLALLEVYSSSFPLLPNKFRSPQSVLQCVPNPSRSCDKNPVLVELRTKFCIIFGAQIWGMRKCKMQTKKSFYLSFLSLFVLRLLRLEEITPPHNSRHSQGSRTSAFSSFF